MTLPLRLSAEALALWAGPALADPAPIPRAGEPSGSVAARQAGERVRFVAEAEFRALFVGQDLLAGDLVRTGPHGLSSLVFVDRTVMRLHPNTELLVAEVRPDGAALELRRGGLWARARRGGDVTVRTPTAAAAIRGTDWALAVEGGGATRLSVYDGRVELSNELGSVTAGPGEQALAEPGRAPVKVQVANRREAEQMLFAVAPADAASPIGDAAEDFAGDAPADPAALAAYGRALSDLRAGRAEAAAGFDAAAPGLDPERAELWNELGLARDALDHAREAEAALRRSMTLAPGDPTAAGNLAILLLDQDRDAEATALAAEMLAADPGSYLGLRAAAREQVQAGDPAATETARRALAAQPAAAESSILLAIAAYQAGDRATAAQELDAAARLDPNDPSVPLIRTVIALDAGEADEAIRQAREAVRLSRLQGPMAAKLAANRRRGSYLADAFATLSLDGWARAVADRTYDPLDPGALFGAANALRPSVGRAGLDASGGEADALAGLQLEPLAASSRLRFQDLLRRPFADAELGGSAAFGDVDGRGARAEVQAFGRLPTPVALSASLSGQGLDGPEPGRAGEPREAVVLLGARPVPHLGLFASFGAVGTDEDRRAQVLGVGLRDGVQSEALSGALGGSWRLAERRFLTFLAAA